MGVERPMFAWRCVQLQARREQKRMGKEEHPVLSPKREDTREETEKETSKGKERKVAVRQESPMNWSALFSRTGNAKHNPHTVIGTHQNAPTTNQKVDANGGARVYYSSTQAKPVKKNGERNDCPKNRRDK